MFALFIAKKNSRTENKPNAKKKRQMGLLSVLEALVALTEAIIERLLLTSPEASRLSTLQNKIEELTATLTAANVSNANGAS
jgi:hypothetical protein